MARLRHPSLTRILTLAVVGLCGTSVGLPYDDRQRNALVGRDATHVGAEPAHMFGPGDGPVVLQHDDGTFESAIGIVNNPQTIGTQGVFLNRFTIPEDLLPFSIDTVSVLFPVSTNVGNTGLVAGQPFEMLVYVDESGSGNPDNTELKVRRAFSLQPSNTVFQDISTGAPVTIQSGDVWIGFTNTVTSLDNEPIFPAAADLNAPQGRSWAFFNDTSGEHFAGESLSASDFGIIFQGNWLIRARGQKGGSTCVRWDAPAGGLRGTLPPPINTRLCDTVPPVSLTEEQQSPGPVMGYNVYRSNTPGVQTTAENRFASVPPNQTNVGSSVAPGGSFFVVTAMYEDGESGPSGEFAIVPPSVTSHRFKNGKLTAKGVNFTATVQVFVDGIPFVSPAVVKKNNTKVVQRGTLITGETFDVYLAQHGNRARIDYRNNNGALQSVDFAR